MYEEVGKNHKTFTSPWDIIFYDFPTTRSVVFFHQVSSSINPILRSTTTTNLTVFLDAPYVFVSMETIRFKEVHLIFITLPQFFVSFIINILSPVLDDVFTGRTAISAIKKPIVSSITLSTIKSLNCSSFHVTVFRFRQ